MHRIKHQLDKIPSHTKLHLSTRTHKPTSTKLDQARAHHYFFNTSKRSTDRQFHPYKRPASNPTPPKSHNKILELHYSPKSPRAVFEYGDNLSASLTLPVKNSQLDENSHNINKLIEFSKSNILEHAARRVDLFFYTLISYYDSNLIPELGWTKLQHGRGRHGFDDSSVTQACHSSFTPSLIDSTLKKRIPIATDSYENLTYKTSLICSTHFMDSLNSTLELPYFVNDLDNELEISYDCRNKSLAILAEVAKGKLNPKQGLEAFLVMMQDTFKHMLEDDHFYKPITHTAGILSVDQSIKLKLSLFELIKKGTLINKWNDKKNDVNDAYLFMLLRLKPDEIKACESDWRIKQKIIHDKVLSIQHEIRSTSSEHAHTRKR